jgi:hypothetical protein
MYMLHANYKEFLKLKNGAFTYNSLILLEYFTHIYWQGFGTLLVFFLE